MKLSEALVFSEGRYTIHIRQILNTEGVTAVVDGISISYASKDGGHLASPYPKGNYDALQQIAIATVYAVITGNHYAKQLKKTYNGIFGSPFEDLKYSYRKIPSIDSNRKRKRPRGSRMVAVRKRAKVKPRKPRMYITESHSWVTPPLSRLRRYFGLGSWKHFPLLSKLRSIDVLDLNAIRIEVQSHFLKRCGLKDRELEDWDGIGAVLSKMGKDYVEVYRKLLRLTTGSALVDIEVRQAEQCWFDMEAMVRAPSWDTWNRLARGLWIASYWLGSLVEKIPNAKRARVRKPRARVYITESR